MRKLQVVPAVHLTWGTVLLCWPGPVLSALDGRTAGEPEKRILRLLGARHLGQAVVTAAVPGPTALTAGGAVDALHAATCLGFALAQPRWRRAASLGGLGAAAFAAAGFALASQARRQAGSG